jgi:CMP-N-acetylneuraminic acid synthetase
MNILITICARGGSKGIPGKNIKLLNGTPLIVYTIDTARQFQKKYQDVDIALSTDSEEIREIAKQYGIQTNYKRPESLGGDTVGKIEVIKDVLLFYENMTVKRYDYIIDLDVTSPLRNFDDLKESFRIIKSDPDAINLFSVSSANKNPYFNMVEQKENGYYALVKQINTTYLTRQSSPKIYELNASFYFYRRLFFDLNYQGAITDKSLIYEMPHICFDLDHPVDFDFLSYLISNNKLDFKL